MPSADPPRRLHDPIQGGGQRGGVSPPFCVSLYCVLVVRTSYYPKQGAKRRVGSRRVSAYARRSAAQPQHCE